MRKGDVVPNSFKSAEKSTRSLMSLCVCLMLLAMPAVSAATVITAFPQSVTVAEGTTFDSIDDGPVGPVFFEQPLA